MTESTRRYVAGDNTSSVKSWLFKSETNQQDYDVLFNNNNNNNQQHSKQSGGRHIKARPKDQYNSMLPPIPVDHENIHYQQITRNDDAAYVNSKFLEHHLRIKKQNKSTIDQSKLLQIPNRPLPEIPLSDRPLPDKPQQPDYRTMELPDVPGKTISSSSSSDYFEPLVTEDQYQSLTNMQTPDDRYYGKVVHHREKVVRENPYQIAVQTTKVVTAQRNHM